VDLKQTLEAMLLENVESASWYPGLGTTLDGLTADDVGWRPKPGAHTIIELVGHIIVSYEVVADRLTGVSTGPNREEDWWPDLGEGEEAWELARQRLQTAWRRLRGLLEGLTDDQCARPMGTFTRPVGPAVGSMVAHAAYHGGQIAVMRRMLGKPVPPW